MPRRVGLAAAPEVLQRETAKAPGARSCRRWSAAATAANGGRVSGRVRHEEKITVYVSAEELLALEQARLNVAGSAQYGGGPGPHRTRGDRCDTR